MVKVIDDDAEAERVWQIGLYGTDLQWFEATGHCGHCGLLGSKCDCTDADQCGCADAHA